MYACSTDKTQRRIHISYIAGTKTSMGAMFEMADKHQWDLHTPICAGANPTGRVTDEAFEFLCEAVLEPLRQV
jgi:microcystin degradation protein MlrC